jgi:DNA (cytosine-5)-methyltransferase 1
VKVGGLCSGIGGLELGLERAGMETIWHAEVDPYASAVLAKHWPHVPNLGDIKTVDWSSVERPDLICAGYPCQPFSLAGVRRGETDPRHLWPHVRDAVRTLRPRYVVLENVPGHLSLGFGRVLGDLAESGYDCEWGCVSAASVGAPHLRWRVFVVAHTDSEGEPGVPVDAVPRPGVMVPDTGRDELRVEPVTVGRRSSPAVARDDGATRAVADADHPRSGQRCAEPPGWTEPVGLAGWWATEPDVGRVAHGVPNRVDRLRTLGNAVVPQVAQWIGERIMERAA